MLGCSLVVARIKGVGRMISCATGRLMFCCVLLWVPTMVVSPARGQGFLDELEKKAREGLGLNDAAGKAAEPAKKPGDGTSELPAPAARRTPATSPNTIAKWYDQRCDQWCFQS